MLRGEGDAESFIRGGGGGGGGGGPGATMMGGGKNGVEWLVLSVLHGAFLSSTELVEGVVGGFSLSVAPASTAARRKRCT